MTAGMSEAALSISLPPPPYIYMIEGMSEASLPPSLPLSVIEGVSQPAACYEHGSMKGPAARDRVRL